MKRRTEKACTRGLRAAAWLLACVLLFAIFATQSRTGLIALFATPLLALTVPGVAARLGWRILPVYALGGRLIFPPRPHE